MTQEEREERHVARTGGRDDRFGLEEAVDGELPVERIQRMIAHAEGCPECADELHRLRTLKDLVRRCCQADIAPQTLRERISVQYHSVSVVTEGRGRTSIERTTIRREDY
jgi:mycothiol system anti-sigma-R factor